MRSILAALMLVNAVTSTAMASCLDEVSSFAEKICGEIKTDGDSSTTVISGELEAELSGMIRKVLGNAKAGTEGKHITDAYKNVLRNDLPQELKSVRQCRMKMVEVGRSELCQPAAAQIPNKRYVSEPQDVFPGVAISYPGTWAEKEAGTGVPRLLPPLNSKEDKAGLEVEISVNSAFREGVENGAGITLPKDEPRDPETLTNMEHLKYIKSYIQSMHEDNPGFSWLSERQVDIPVYSDSEDPPDRKTTERAWVVDYIEDGRRVEALHFFQQTSYYGAPAETFGLVTVTCIAPSEFFDSVEAACKSVLDNTVAISGNYFAD
ncbi:hypothetical protein [Pseudomonas sp. zfem002]|uniref:hypothetical protein n=1 Tax=Pseudomonas sp. zfem002 TaxID=3078197 RepID=UPI002928397C|nr:hypothetical protein [Pseudomonas sp. zfem002]MDU9393344.1 hypothetical protein [Pseudomonas sp. zfem002]